MIRVLPPGHTRLDQQHRSGAASGGYGLRRSFGGIAAAIERQNASSRMREPEEAFGGGQAAAARSSAVSAAAFARGPGSGVVTTCPLPSGSNGSEPGGQSLDRSMGCRIQ